MELSSTGIVLQVYGYRNQSVFQKNTKLKQQNVIQVTVCLYFITMEMSCIFQVITTEQLMVHRAYFHSLTKE